VLPSMIAAVARVSHVEKRIMQVSWRSNSWIDNHGEV